MAAKGGSSDLVAQLAKQPLANKLAILAGVLGLLGFVYWQFFYSELSEARASEQRLKAKHIQDGKKFDEQLDEMAELIKEKAELDKVNRDNQRALPTERELAAFYDHLQKKAGDARVSIKRWERKKEEPAQEYVKVPVEMAVQGSFYQILRYFSALGPQPKSAPPAAAEEDAADPLGGDAVGERIVSIENLTIGDPEVINDEIMLTARFTASTFRQKDGAMPPPSAGASGGKVGAARAQREKQAADAAAAGEDGAGKGSKK